MTKETLRSVVRRAETVDVLADNLKPLIYAAAELGIVELFGIIDILNKRGVKKHVLNSYGKLCLNSYLLEEKERQRQAARPVYMGLSEEYDCLK